MIERRDVLLGGLASVLAGPAFAQPMGMQPPPPQAGPPANDRIQAEPRGAMPMQPSTREVEFTPQPQPPRISAFVVSQSYRGTPAYTLGNTTQDAALIGRSFQQLKFDAVSAMIDADADQTVAGVTNYLRTVDANTISIIYVAGHGLEIGGENLLLLAGGQSFLSLQALVQTLRERAGIAILFLDACRNNPFLSTLPPDGTVSRAIGVSRGIELQTASFADLRTRGRGQASVVRPFTLQGSGIKIVFSTDPANVAYDDVAGSRNSPFAQALARSLRRQISLDDIISLTTGDVLRATNRRQSPWSQGSIDRPIFLSGPRRRLQSELSAR